jgi:hypothetical protein
MTTDESEERKYCKDGDRLWLFVIGYFFVGPALMLVIGQIARLF